MINEKMNLTEHILAMLLTMTQKQVSELTGIHPSIISQIHNGKQATDRQAEVIAKHAGVVFADFKIWSYDAVIHELTKDYDELRKQDKTKLKLNARLSDNDIQQLRKSKRLSWSKLVAMSERLGYHIKLNLPEVKRKGVKNGFTGWAEPY